jgi:O-antigen ligase
VSVEAAYELATGGPKLLVVIPISVLLGLALVIIGLVNFQLFVFITIAIRSSLDIARADLGNNGTASGGTATATASGLDPAGALAIIFMVASLFWFMSRRMGKETSPPPSVHRIALSTFAITGFLSVIASSRPVVSLLEAIRVSAVAVMLAVMEILLVDRAAIKRLLLAIYLSALVPVGLTLFYIALHKPQFTSGGFGRYQGTFSQPNPFAIYLCMLIVMGAALLPHLKVRVRILMVLLMAASVVCLYHTYTRSAWVATLIGVVAVAIIGRRKVLGAVLFACLVVGLLAVPTISQRFADLASVAGGGSSVNAQGNTSNSVVWRFSYWSEVLPLANSNPVTGIGLKMSSFLTDQAKEPHNDFLRAYVETGVIGAVAYFALLISMVLVARQSLKEAGPGFDHCIAVGFAGCVIAFVLISIVSNVITEVIVLWYYVAFAAAAYAVTKFPGPPRPSQIARPPRQQVPVPARWRRVLHVRSGEAADRRRRSGGFFRHGPPRQPADAVRQSLSQLRRVPTGCHVDGVADPRDGADAVLALGRGWNRGHDRRFPARCGSPAQHLSPALAIGAATPGARGDSGCDDAPRLQAGVPDVPVPGSREGLRSMPRRPLLSRRHAPM